MQRIFWEKSNFIYENVDECGRPVVIWNPVPGCAGMTLCLAAGSFSVMGAPLICI